MRLALTQFLLQSPDGCGVAFPVPREPEALERHHSTTAHNSITAHHPPLDRLAHLCTLNAYTNELLLSGGNALRVISDLKCVCVCVCVRDGVYGSERSVVIGTIYCLNSSQVNTCTQLTSCSCCLTTAIASLATRA